MSASGCTHSNASGASACARSPISWRRRITMTETIMADQFISAAPEKVWEALTTPELHAQWWAPGDIAGVVGHRFHLDMPGRGPILCEVAEVREPELFVFTFNGTWTISWRLVPEGKGTRLFLEHSGFDLEND